MSRNKGKSQQEKIDEEIDSKEDFQIDEQSSDLATVIAQKVEYLFENCRKPNGEKYTTREVEKLTGGKVAHSWIWKIANGQVARPGFESLKAISDFFKVEPSFWFDNSNSLSVSVNSEAVRNIALRASKLPPKGQQFLLDVLDSYESSLTDTED